MAATCGVLAWIAYAKTM